MKRILLRFESNIVTILSLAILVIVMGISAGIAFFDGIISVGCLFSILCAVSVAFLLYYALRKEVVIDFKRNLLKMKAGVKKQECELDKVKNLEIVFHKVDRMNCYSAQVFAYLKDGRTISIKIYPESFRYRWTYSVTGRVTCKSKLRVERQVKGYDFIACRTKE